MSSFFKFDQAVPDIFQFQCSKKRDVFKQDFRENLHIWKGTKKKIFEVCFCNLLEKNTNNFVKIDRKF